MRLSIAFVLLAFVPSVRDAWAQSPQEQAMARQLASLDQQRATARQQLGTRATDSHAFFTTGWTAPIPRREPPPQETASFDCDPLSPKEANALIEENAAKHGITPDVLRAVIRRESAFHPCAVSNKGAMGLMQLMPGTAGDLGVMDPFDPAENIRGGSKYLKQLLDRYQGDLMLALSAYNAGPGRVDAAGGVPDIKETRDYVREIMQRVSN